MPVNPQRPADTHDSHVGARQKRVAVARELDVTDEPAGEPPIDNRAGVHIDRDHIAGQEEAALRSPPYGRHNAATAPTWHPQLGLLARTVRCTLGLVAASLSAPPPTRVYERIDAAALLDHRRMASCPLAMGSSVRDELSSYKRI